MVLQETLAQVKVFSSSVSNMSTKEERLRDFVLANSGNFLVGISYATLENIA